MVCPKIPDEFLTITKSVTKVTEVNEPNSPFEIEGNDPCPGCGYELKHRYQTYCPGCGHFLIWK